jgi:hypothetical protein
MDIRTPTSDSNALDGLCDFIREHLVSSLDLTTIRTLIEAVCRHDCRLVLDVWHEDDRALVACLMAGIGDAGSLSRLTFRTLPFHPRFSPNAVMAS